MHSPVTAAVQIPEPSSSVTRHFVRNAIMAWGFGAAFFQVTQGAVFTAFALSVGANDFVFGVLGAALPLMSVLQMAAARAVQRYGKRKRQILIAGLSSRLFWLTAALLPLLLHSAGNRRVLPLVIGCILLASACQAFYLPAFFSWVSDAVPSRLRGPFFARRMQVGTLVAIAATVLSGYIADLFPVQPVYCAVLAVTALAGLFEFLLFRPIPEAQPRQSYVDRSSPAEVGATQISARDALRDAPPRHFLIFTSLMYIGYGSAGAFL